MKPITARFLTAVLLCLSSSALAQNWGTVVGACAGTDNNYSIKPPSVDYPVARFATPGGTFTFNAFHDGYIAVHCPVLSSLPSPAWNQLMVTYTDPDGLQGLQGRGTEYQTVAELVRVSKVTGALASIAKFDSNLQCQGSVNCQANTNVKTYSLGFSHSFDFNNYTYVVYVRLYRALATFGLRPAAYQVSLQ